MRNQRFALALTLLNLALLAFLLVQNRRAEAAECRASAPRPARASDRGRSGQSASRPQGLPSIPEGQAA